jgi:hypothetical protein
MTNSDDQKKGCLPTFLRGFGAKPKAEKESAQKYPYLLKDYFLSPTELDFYLLLRYLVPGKTVIRIKPRLADIFKIDRNVIPYTSESRIYFNKISQRHVDFLLCHGESLDPMVGVELDQANQQDSEEVIHDEFVDSVFEAANLPLVHIQAQEEYSQGKIARQLSPFWESPDPPNCPKCDRPMLIRTAKSGEHEGKKFYVCPDTKNCRTYFAAEN